MPARAVREGERLTEPPERCQTLERGGENSRRRWSSGTVLAREGFMRLITYLFAAALLWAVATSGPASPTLSTAAAQPEQPAAPPGARASAYPR
jgi:hypothetical protein